MSDDFASPEMDPQRAYDGVPWELFRCCLLRTLYSYNGRPTEEGGAEPRPDLAAEPADVSADGLTWTFRLRDGLLFAPPFEDTPIAASDIVRALERTARVGTGPRNYGFYYDVIRGFEAYTSGRADSIAGLETPDDRTLIVRLSQVTGDLAYRFSLPATAPIPVGADEGHDEDYARYLVASGPYMIEGSGALDFTLAPDQQEPTAGFVPAVRDEDGAVEEPGSLVLVRNPSWNPATDPLRAAYPQRIELTLGGLDEEEIARRVDSAETDLGLGGSPFEQVARYQEDPALEDRLFVHPSGLIFFVTMNTAVQPFDDVHVRRAASLAIDKAALLELLAEPPHGPFGFSYGEVPTHMAPDEIGAQLLRAFDPYPYDPAAARVEMRASPYDRDRDGRCDAPTCRNVGALVMDAGVLPGQARAIREDLADIGIDLALDIVSVDRFFTDVQDPGSRTRIGIAYTFGADFPDGGGWFSMFGREGLGHTNWSLVGALPRELRTWGYSVGSVPSVEDRLQACRERRGPSRIQCWAEFDQYLGTEIVPGIPYVVTELAQVVSERVVGYSFDQWVGAPALDRIALAPGSE